MTAAASLVLAQQPSTDWTQWRGPNRDGNATTFTPPAVWPDTLVQKWKVEVGTGYASPIVVDDRVYVFSRRGTNEGMSAHDAVTGRELWRFGYEAPFTMNSASARHNAGPKSTPVFANGRLLSIGMTGVVTAWDAATGRTLWQKPGSEPVPMYTTHAFSPIVEGDLAVFHLGGHDQGAVTAFDIATVLSSGAGRAMDRVMAHRSSLPSAGQSRSSQSRRPRWWAWMSNRCPPVGAPVRPPERR